MHVNKPARDFLFEAVGRATFACFYLAMLYGSVTQFAQSQRPGLLLYILLQSLVVIFVICRNAPRRLSLSPLDWLVALLPTLMPLFLEAGNGWSMAGGVIQYLGALILIAGVISLNSSLGVVAADRGIKTGGIYRLVRHPLFLGYIIANIGVLINNFTRFNIFCIAAGSLLQIVRIFREEKFLSENAVYQDYKLKTRWRLFPNIW